MTNLAMARAFARVWTPITKRLNEAAEADAEFDGGEWSRAAHASIAQEEFDLCLARCATAMGVSQEHLENCVCMKWQQEYAHESLRYDADEFLFLR